ncbi:MAG: carboxypeptidase regulatory-like domain-containing protein [Leptolyngbyaceae cyanobacterium SM1_1_3]|nr:carboxypeptidase regulatory-like domain-containing protein [Leptolyngbyaceae cyanobacterium SM1_1_3]NJN02886.1 carboxypeptidase regulatory-like domain-containing protein [Leptolyngbyaceae cyanobacterium RM1_1_2]NJO11564.1 carboxypeptidase regulatory-like domain-containing protein [Leptolyngbyaceae cyanobacterium SL_1_1]
MKAKLLMPVAAIALLGLPASALAHAVQTNYFVPLFSAPSSAAINIESSASDKSEAALVLESSFGDGTPFVGATVSVYAPNDAETPWQVGTTDDSGQFAFAPDRALSGSWTVRIQQEGHEDILTIPVGETGIEFENISQWGSDVHYAEVPPLALVIMASVGGIALGIASVRRQSEPV